MSRDLVVLEREGGEDAVGAERLRECRRPLYGARFDTRSDTRSDRRFDTRFDTRSDRRFGTRFDWRFDTIRYTGR